MQLLSGQSGVFFFLYGATYQGQTFGVWQVDKLSDPAFLTLSSGIWGYVQVASYTSTLNGGTPQTFSGLDNGFPYEEANGNTNWTAADNQTARTWQDSPGAGPLPPAPLTYSFSGDFNLYIFYKPPADAAGDSVYIPFRLLPWASKGRCSATSGGQWSQQDDGSGWSPGAGDYPWPFPTW